MPDLAGVPSPKFQMTVVIDPSGSREPEPLKVSVMSVCVAWFGPASAVGILFVESVVVVTGRVVVVVVVGTVPAAMAARAMSDAADHVPALSWTQSVAE